MYRETKNKMKAGFTLTELVIVVTILGVLAAIGIPIYINMADDAKSAASQAAINSIRSALHIKSADDAMNGGTGACPALTTAIFANAKMPKNPNNKLDTVKIMTGSCLTTNLELDNTTGWLYKQSTCSVCLNSTGTDSVSGNAWVTF